MATDSLTQSMELTRLRLERLISTLGGKIVGETREDEIQRLTVEIKHDVEPSPATRR